MPVIKPISGADAISAAIEARGIDMDAIAADIANGVPVNIPAPDPGPTKEEQAVMDIRAQDDCEEFQEFSPDSRYIATWGIQSKSLRKRARYTPTFYDVGGGNLASQSITLSLEDM